MTHKRLPFEEFNFIYSKVPRLVVDLAAMTDWGIVLTKRRITPYKGMWHTPGGTVFKGETLEDAVSRVALEEIGVKVKIERILGINEILRDGNTGRHTVSVVFLVTPKSTHFRGDNQSDKIKVFKIIPQNTIPIQKRFLTEHIKIK